jgi:uncharacterized repeat protein (TIGR03803 family)
MAGLIMDGSGNLYGTTEAGGADNYGTVFKLTPGSGGSYTESVLYSFQGGTADGAYPQAGLIMDNSGNLYGTTEEGGTGSCSANGSTIGCGTVFKLTPGSGGCYTESVLHNFQGGTSDGADPWAGLIMDSNGDLYGTTTLGGASGGPGSCSGNGSATGCGTVFKLTLGNGGSYTESVLHYFQGGTSDGANPYAGLIIDSNGNLYGTSSGGGNAAGTTRSGTACSGDSCGTVFRLAPGSGGDYIESLVYSFKAGFSDGSYPDAGLIMDGSGNLYGTTTEGGTGVCTPFGCGTVFEIIR